MSESVFIATPEAGLVGVHGWDGSAWKKLLVNSSGELIRNDDFSEKFVQETLLASGVKAASWVSTVKTNPGYIGALFEFRVTAIPGTDTVKFIFYHNSDDDDNYITLFQGATTDAAAQHLFFIGLGGVKGDGGLQKVAGIILPYTYRWGVTHSGSGNFTYSINALWIKP